MAEIAKNMKLDYKRPRRCGGQSYSHSYWLGKELMIISPQKKKCIVEVGEYNGERYQTVWRMGEFSVNELPQLESDGSVTMDPSTLIGRWDEWETTIPTTLRSWDIDKQPIESEDFKNSYKVLHYKILNGFEVNGVRRL